MQTDSNHLPVPLKPHLYPIWIYLFGLLLILMTAYSLYLLPTYYNAAKDYHLAKNLYERGQYDKTVQYLQKVMQVVPSSKNAKFVIAKCYFVMGGEDNYKLAMYYLENMRLSNEQYNELKLVMPSQFQQFFETKWE